MPGEVTDTLSIDYAWGGTLSRTSAGTARMLSTEERLYVSEWRDSYTIQGAVVILTVALLLSVRRIVALTPYLLGCLVRMKEILNLENILKISRQRNGIAALSVLSFALIGSRYRFAPAPNHDGLMPVEVFWMLLGIPAALAIVRRGINAAFSAWSGKGAYGILRKSAYTYFIVFTAFLCIVTAGMYIWGVRDGETYRSAALVAGAAVWIIYVVREIQIFMHWNCSPYSSFLYLCTLDFVPMGVITYLTVAY